MSEAFRIQRLTLFDVWPDLSRHSPRADELAALMYRATQRKPTSEEIRACLRDANCHVFAALEAEAGRIVGVAVMHIQATLLGARVVVTSRAFDRAWAAEVERPLYDKLLECAQEHFGAYRAIGKQITFLS